MSINGFLKNSIWALVLSAAALNSQGAPTSIATVPLATSSTTSVLPNIMYVLDDSGSMDWDFLPDWACAQAFSKNNSTCNSTGSDAANFAPNYLFFNNDFNGVYYNPGITYSPPAYYTATGASDTTTYPSMTGQSVATGGGTSAAPNWTAVKVDGYGIQSASTSNLQGKAFYWTIIPGEYCNAANMTSCIATSTPSGSNTFPAKLRWCNSNTLTNCKATFGNPGNTYTFFRAPSPPTATLTVSTGTVNSVSHITINGQEILSATAPTTTSTSASTVATSIATNINACTFGLSGNCQTVGYSASLSATCTSSACSVIITAPANVAGNSAYTPAVTRTSTAAGTLTVTPAAFAAAPFYASSTVPGSNLLTVIHSGNNSYVLPGTNAKATARTDCAAATCTYAEEMTNFANWFAYYHTRMQMMKTAASMAFATIGATFRVGYMSISTMNGTPNTAKDFMNLNDFTAANKFAWYKNFFAANPGNSTPLRAALATAGRLYGGQLNGTNLNGVAVVDPMQFSCQQNFTILSTDGYWNEPSNPKQLNGSTDIGQQDGSDPQGRPFIDGATVTYTKNTVQNLQTQSQALQSTSQVQSRTTQIQSRTTQLQIRTVQNQSTTTQIQSRTQQIQSRTTQIQSRTTQIQTTTVQNQTRTVQNQTRTVQNQIRTTQLQKRTVQFQMCKPNGTQCSNISFDCTGGTGDPTKTLCKQTLDSGFLNASSCTAGAGSPVTFCQTTDTGFVNVATCAASGPTGGQTVTCRVASDSGFVNTATCAASNPAGGPTVTCNVLSDTGFVNTATCSASNPAGGPTVTCNVLSNTTVNSASCSASNPPAGPTVTCTTTDTGFVNATSCAASGPTAGKTVTCQTTDTGFVNATSCAASGPTAGKTVTCQTTDTGFVNAASCAASGPTNGQTVTCKTTPAVLANVGTCTPSSSGGQTVTCQVLSDSGLVNAISCSASNPPAGPTVTCTSTDTGFVNATSCTASGPTVGKTVTCQTTDTGSVMAAGGVCTPSGPTAGKIVTCPPTVTTGPTIVASCTPALASAANNFTRTICDTNPATPAQTPVASCTPVAGSVANGFLGTACSQNNTGPTTVSSCTADAASSLNSWTATTCTLLSVSGGISNTLADVAEYYYLTDLRTTALGNCTGTPVPPASTGNTLCTTATPDPFNNVPTSGLDGASWQHMTTFTLGLGATGFMQFSPTYLIDPTGDFFDVKNGTTANPAGGICNWQSAGTACNWPAPVSNGQTTIDDLWHAAVNGRASYFSATNPSSLSSGLSNALSGVSARLGGSAAATTSNPNITSGDNFVFSSTFSTNTWDGQLFRQQLDLTTGVTSTTIDWSARDQLDTNASRTIYTFSSGATNNLKLFTWTGLASGSSNDQSNFTTPHISSSPPAGVTGMSQFCAAGATCLSAASQTDASGQKLVDFLRGDSSNEGASTDPSKYYRSRSHRLGDIVDAEAVYVKASLFTYADAGYMGTGGFSERNSTRAGRVYVAANDGMLHAFDATTGAEVWAYVPALVLPNLYTLADKDYANRHTYFLDGTPISGEICPTAPATPCTGSTWKTILVGGLNRGGRGYYALDVTDPAAPKALWEFTDTNMGFTFGNPEIAKLKDGTWVVMLTSGYNNMASTSWAGAGDGGGYLYVLNAATGALIGTPIPTNDASGVNVGSATTPSGLARIRAYVENAMVDNTALRTYGGDLLGNVWRFDINGDIGPAGKEAQRLVTLFSDTATAGTVPQPITARPELGDCNGNKIVLVGTGKFLGQTDIDVVPGKQSMYGIKDKLDATSFGNPQASASGFIQQTLTSTTCPAGTSSSVCTTGQSVRTATNNVVNLASDNGWYLNYPDSGERDNTDPTLGLATLAFNTNVPSDSSCVIGGFSFRYFVNFCTGAPIGAVGTGTGATSGVVSVRLGNALATRPVLVRLPSNAIVELTRLSDGTTVTSDVPIGPGVALTRRVSWRELTNDQ